MSKEKNQERSIVCFCSDCKKYSLFGEGTTNLTCSKCKRAVKVLQVCPTCENWYMQAHENEIKCQKCGIGLVNPRKGQYEPIISLVPQVKPDGAVKDDTIGEERKDREKDGILELYFCINCGEESYADTITEPCKKCNMPIGEFKSGYKTILERIGMAEHPARSLIFVLPIFIVNWIIRSYMYGSLNSPFSLWGTDIAIDTSILALVIFLSMLVSSVYKESLKIYNPRGIKENEVSQDILRAFINEREMIDFKIKARGLLFSKAEWLLALGMAGSFGGLFVSLAVPASYIDAFGVLGPFVYRITNTIGWIINGFLLGAALSLIFGVVRVMSLLTREREDFAIFHFAKKLRSMEDTNIKELFATKPVIFSEFERIMRIIGMFLYKICLRLLFIGIFISLLLMVVFSFLSADLLTGVALSLLVLVIVLLLFIIPQWKVHVLLSEIKERLVFSYKRIHDRAILEYLSVVKTNKPFIPVGHWESKEDMRDDVELLKHICEDINGVSTWTFNFPAVFKLIGAGLAPIIIAILQIVFQLGA